MKLIKHGFGIGVGPLSFNLTSLDKDTPLIRVGFRQHVLSKQPQQPCLVLQLRDLTVMLDCSLDMSSLQHFLPLVQVPSEKLDSLKPWTCNEFSGLPAAPSNLHEIAGQLFIDSTPEVCLPEYCEFNGKIYMTEPTFQIGRLLMEEVVNYHENCQRTKSSSIWKKRDIQKFLPYPLCDQPDAESWKTFYRDFSDKHGFRKLPGVDTSGFLLTSSNIPEVRGVWVKPNHSMHDVKSCMSKIQPIDYGEKLLESMKCDHQDVYGLLQVTALSSGFCIGSCNWLLQTNFHKITYLSSSSVFSTHPQPLDQTSVKESDVLIMNSLTEAPTANPDTMLREFCNNLAVTLKNNGNVLVPCYPTGVLYDLFEYLSSFMEGSGLAMIPMYFISPAAESSLAHANIYAEWTAVSSSGESSGSVVRKYSEMITSFLLYILKKTKPCLPLLDTEA